MPYNRFAPPTSIPDLVRANASVASSHDDWLRGLPMRDALGARGVPTEYLQVPGEGHKYAKPKSRRLIAATLVDFLGRHGLVETPNLSLLDARIAEMKAGAPGVED